MKKWMLLVAALTASSAMAQANTVTVRDIAGRTVMVPRDPQRIILGEGRLLFATALLDREDPFKRLVAWGDDLIKNAPDAYKKYKAAFPDSAGKVQNLGTPYKIFSTEQVIVTKPDLVILTETQHTSLQESGLLDRLDSMKIPYIFVDFREDTIKNTVPSISILGKALNQEARAKEYIDFYNKNMAIIKNRIARTSTRPLVFVDRAAGHDPNQCCKTFGPHSFGEFIEVAGGRNWGSTLTDKLAADVSPEAVIKANPDVIIATTADWENTLSVPLGYTAQPSRVNARMRGLAQRTGFNNLKAIQNKQFYAIYHQFYNSPYNVFAIQQIAKWLHPDEFRDVDPQANFIEMHRRLLPISYSGIFWTQLK